MERVEKIIDVHCPVRAVYLIDKAGDALGIFDRRVERTVQEFKKFIESRAQVTGAWRGEVDHGRRVR